MSSASLFKYILVLFDGSESSRKALGVGLGLAKALEANLALVTVEELPRFAGDVGEIKDEKDLRNNYCAMIQREAREMAKLQGMDFERADVLVGHVAQTIISHAKTIGCDLIVMGHSGRSGVWGRFLGSTADKVSRYAHCTVVIVR